MNEVFKYILSNNLKNLEGFKVNGEIILDKSVMMKALKESKKVKTPKKKVNIEAPEIEEESFETLLNNVQVQEFNFTSVEDKVSLRFNISKV